MIICHIAHHRSPSRPDIKVLKHPKASLNMLLRPTMILHLARPLLLGALLLAGGTRQGLAKPAAAPLAQPKASAKATTTTYATELTTRGMILTIKTVAADGSTTVTTRTYGSIASPLTNDKLGVYTSRPLLAVGDVKEVNLTSQTITLQIDRALSSLPHVLEVQAKKKGVLDKLLDRVFPAERTFFIRRTTLLIDGTGKTRVSALASPRERLERTRLKLEDFHPGDRVSLLFRYHENEATPPAVMNVSKQSRERRDYAADYRPVPIVQRVVTPPTSATLARTPLTSNTQAITNPAAQALLKKPARGKSRPAMVPRPK